MLNALALLICYLLGSVSGSLVLGRLVGVDIRQSGSGNAGGTNALRTRGWRFALAVVVIDVGKGALAACVPAWLDASTPWPMAMPAAAVLMAAIGHIWPVFFGFRGGKGAAVLIGGLVVIWPLALIAVLAVWLLVLISSGYVGLATVLATAVLIPMAAIDITDSASVRWGFALLATVLIVYTHRANLRRLRAGREHRFEKVRLFGRTRRR